MTEGFWGRYFKDLLRFFPYANDVEIRREAGKEVHSIRSLNRLALKKIPRAFWLEHNIKKGFRYEDLAEKKGIKADHVAWLIGFNAGEQVLIGLNKINRLEELLIKIRKKHPTFGREIDMVEYKLQQDLEKGLFLGKSEERRLYLKDLGAVMKVAERASLDSTVMQNLLQLTKKKEDISSLATIGFRRPSRVARRAISRIGKGDQRIERLFLKLEHMKLDKNPKKAEKQVAEAAATLKKLFKMLVNDLHIMFENTYKLWRRDFYTELVLLRLLDETAKMEYRSIEKKIAPREPTLKNIADIGQIRDGIAKHAHFLAQEFRILMSKEDSVRRNVRIEGELTKRGLALARKKAAA